MTIVQVVDDLNAGGLERFVIDLAVAHQRAGHRSIIYCLHEPGKLAGQAETAGIPVRAFHKGPGLKPGVLWRVWRSLARDRPDVVHAHNPGVHHYAAVAARLAGVPVTINTRHGVSSSSGARFNERYFKLALRWTSKVVYVSTDSERYYTGQGIVPGHQGVTIWNGTPLEAFLNAPKQPRSGPMRLVTVGRLVPVKGHAMLLEAFARLKTDAELRIYGDGPLRGELERLRGRALLPGATADIPGALAAADVFVFSSTSEGQPMVILEALASGLPIVSTRVGGVPEVAPEGEVAWYCEPGDPAAFAELLDRVLADPVELERRGARARQYAMEKLSIEVAQRNYEKLYRQLLDE